MGTKTRTRGELHVCLVSLIKNLLQVLHIALKALPLHLARTLFRLEERAAALQFDVLLLVHSTVVDKGILAGSVKGIALLAVDGWVMGGFVGMC